MDRRYKIA